MIAWTTLLDLGGVALTLPLAAAIGAALVASGALRPALWWGALFCSAVALVGASKIAYMSWGYGIDALCFKALSGHATGATAVYPMLGWVLLHRLGERARIAGLAGGLGVGTVVTMLLASTREHSVSEAAAGWVIGAVVSLLAIRQCDCLPQVPPLRSVLIFVLVCALGAWLMQWAHLGYWMIKAARLLSGNERVFNLNFEYFLDKPL